MSPDRPAAIVQIHEDGLFHLCHDDGRPDYVTGDEDELMRVLVDEVAERGASVGFGSSCDFPAEWGRPDFAVDIFRSDLADAVAARRAGTPSP